MRVWHFHFKINAINDYIVLKYWEDGWIVEICG